MVSCGGATMSDAVRIPAPGEPPPKAPFRPKPVGDFPAAGLNPIQVEGLVLKFLLGAGVATGRRIASELALPFGPFPEFFRHLQNQKTVSFTYATAAGDYDYTLTDIGRARAEAYLEECAYVGPAPVPYAEYEAAVAAQTIVNEHPKEADLRRAFSDLLIAEEMFQILG